MDGHVHRAAQRDRDGREAGVMPELLVFGRTEYDDPLTERGTASREDDVLARNLEKWVELVAFPRTAVHWIIRDGEDAESDQPVRTGR
jgi:hypothetical protein